MSVASDNASVVRGHFFSSFFFMWKGAEQVSLVAMSDFYTAWNYRRTKKNHIHKYVSGRQLSFLYIYTIFTLTLTSISRGTIEKTYGSFQVSELDAFSRRGWSFSQRSRQNTTPFFLRPNFGTETVHVHNPRLSCTDPAASHKRNESPTKRTRSVSRLCKTFSFRLYARPPVNYTKQLCDCSILENEIDRVCLVQC